MVAPHLKHPFPQGSDCAGTVVEVGPGVTMFKVGDRVVGHAMAIDKKASGNPEAAFQEYTVLRTNLVAKIPDRTSFEDACVIPLGLSTAACAMFEKDQLGLQWPTSPPNKHTGKTLLLWAGSTSVGCNALQLAVAAGYDVITTCSPRNFALVKKLGASEAFDYNSASVIKDIVAAFKGRTVAGAISCSNDSGIKCVEVLSKVVGDKKHSGVSYPLPSPFPKTFVIPRMIAHVVPAMAMLKYKTTMNGVKHGYAHGATLAWDEVGGKVYNEFLGKALEEGTFVPAPEPLIVGHGLEKMQEAYDVQQKGVSAKKVVVTV